MPAENIVNGNEGASRDVLDLFSRIQSRAVSVLDDLDSSRKDMIRSLQSTLDRINAMAIRISELENSSARCLFSVSSMSRIDQDRTSATIRLDANSATLLEKDHRIAEANLDSLRFSASAGSVESVAPAWRVISPQAAPTGTFDLLFRSPVESGVVIFDTVLSAQEADIEVLGSLQGVRYEPVDRVIRSGYRVTCWIGKTRIRHLRIRIRPWQPDSPGGSSYTFGITDVRVLQSRYFLRSEFWSDWVVWTPNTPKVRFSAPSHDGLSYYLWIGDPPAGSDTNKDSLSLFSVQPGQVIQIPGSRIYTDIPATVDASGNVVMTIDGSQTNIFPSNTMPGSVRVVDISGPEEQEMKVWPELAANQLIPIDGYALSLTYNTQTGAYHADRLKALDLSYQSRPLKVSFWTISDRLASVLLVQMVSHSEYATPVFTGAVLESWS